MEHPQEPPDTPGFIGRPISSESFRRCIHCHSTNFRAVLEPDQSPAASDRGIGCERCHGPGGHHPAAVAASFAELAIAVPRLAPAAQIVALCGDCHTAPAKTTAQDASFVRYQASGLVLSRCYKESDQSLSCTTCHDPHKDVETRASFYESVCLKCHGPGSPPRNLLDADNKTSRSCPVSAERGCLECHMPRITNAVPRTIFTDHQIRIRHD